MSGFPAPGSDLAIGRKAGGVSLTQDSHSVQAGASIGGSAAPLSLGPEARGAERFTLLVRSAKLVVDDREYLCVLRDASATGVKIRLFHPMPTGKKMALELANGEQHPMQMMWNRDDHAGFRFDVEIDVRALIDDRGKYPKRQIRARVGREVTLCAHSREFAALLVNISQQGACVDCAERLMLREAVRLEMEGFPPVVARVVWRDQSRYGVVFECGFGLEELAKMLATLLDGARIAPAR